MKDAVNYKNTVICLRPLTLTRLSRLRRSKQRKSSASLLVAFLWTLNTNYSLRWEVGYIYIYTRPKYFSPRNLLRSAMYTLRRWVFLVGFVICWTLSPIHKDSDSQFLSFSNQSLQKNKDQENTSLKHQPSSDTTRNSLCFVSQPFVCWLPNTSWDALTPTATLFLSKIFLTRDECITAIFQPAMITAKLDNSESD